ncbi:MAG: hypothetical protein P4L10_01840 [Acidobacteriaceae bacterium]|nr:hypothetical protein [Acidobacteriaceae bacterium]
MKNSKMRKSLSYILMYVVLNALSNGQTSQSLEETQNRGKTVKAGPGAAEPPESQPDSPSVVCDGNELKISSNNSTLASILAEVQKCTGAKIEVPDGVAKNRVFKKLGPGPTRDVLASLLTSNDFNYVIGSSPSDPDKVETVLLMSAQGDAATGTLPASSLTSTNSTGLQTYEDGKLAPQPAQVHLAAAPDAPETMARRVPVADQVEKTLTSAVQTSADDPAPAPHIATPVALVSSTSTPLNASPRTVPQTSAFAEARINSNGRIDRARWRDELTGFGISADASDERLTFVARTANVKAAREELSWYPVSLRATGEDSSSGDGRDAIILPAVVKGQMPTSELESIGDESNRQNRILSSHPMEMYTGAYFADAASALDEKTRYPMGFPISLEELGKAIWQAGWQIGLIAPLTSIILILLCQMFVTSHLKTRIFLLAVPLSAIGAVWSLCLIHSSLAAAVWVGIIGLLSIQAEAAVFRLLHLERANERAESRGDL